MRRKLVTLGMVGLIILGVTGCSKNKFKLTRSQPTDTPYYNPSNDTCFVCHTISTLKKTIGNEIVPLYVNREKFARSIHRANRCVDCHADIVWDNVKKEHPIVPKYYGGWANFSAEDIIQGRNYYTFASISCFNNICHPDQEGFASSQHYLIQDIRNSRAEFKSGIFIGRDYEVSCNKCHLTCATCHFKGEKRRSGSGEVIDYWSQLLMGNSIPSADSLTNWAIDWTANVESHDFAAGEELSNSNDLCQVCHTGFYTNYNKTGYYHPDGLSDFDSLVSQGVEKYPKYEERKLIKGDIVVHTGIPSLDSAYERIINEGVMKEYSCTYCHDRIHSLTPITCKKCHSVSFNKFGYTFAPHLDVACVACHDATMNVWRVNYSIFPRADTVRVAAVKDNKVIEWHSHMLIKPEEGDSFCDRKCHNPETAPRIGATPSKGYSGNIHDDD